MPATVLVMTGQVERIASVPDRRCDRRETVVLAGKSGVVLERGIAIDEQHLRKRRRR